MDPMRTVLSRIMLITIAVCGATLVPTPARAIVISMDPLVSVVNEGDSFGVDIWVSGLERRQDEIVSAFDLDVLFRGSILGATGFTFSSELGDPDDPDEVITGFSSSFGYADIFAVSFLSDNLLAAGQGNRVLLGQLWFDALREGVTLLSFGDDPQFGRNIVGRDALSLDPVLAIPSITVVRASVPEPGTLALLGLGLLGLAICKRRLQPAPPAHRSST